MHTTLELIELAKQQLAAKHGLDLPMSDYRLSKLMGIRQTTISSWRVGRSHIGTEFAVRFAEACDLPAEYVYACVQRERADNADEISLLERIAAAFKETKVAALVFAVMVAAGMSFAPAGNQAVAAVSADNTLPIMRPRRRRGRTPVRVRSRRGRLTPRILTAVTNQDGACNEITDHRGIHSTGRMCDDARASGSRSGHRPLRVLHGSNPRVLRSIPIRQSGSPHQGSRDLQGRDAGQIDQSRDRQEVAR